ncbi:MAG: hypothetical protein ACRCW0_02035 [Clostridium sp.]
MKTFYGYIGKNGSVLSRSNTGHFHVSKIDTGIYEVSFEPHFETIPIVVATQVWKDSGPSGGNTLDNVVLIDITQTKFRIKTGGMSGHPSDREFTFIALGE